MTDEPLTVATLTGLLAAYHPDTPVRLATQPEWPFAYALAATATAIVEDGVVWLATTNQLGYLPGGIRDALTDAATPTWT
jgi:hypothetical protein